MEIQIISKLSPQLQTTLFDATLITRLIKKINLQECEKNCLMNFRVSFNISIIVINSNQ